MADSPRSLPPLARRFSPLLLLVGCVLYALGFPPLGWSAATLLGVGLLAYIARDCRFVTLWSYGIVLHFALYAWLGNVSYFAVVALAGLMGALWALPFHLIKRWGHPLGIAAIWMLLELVRTQIGWGWLPLSASAVSSPMILGWVVIGGQILTGLLIAICGLLLGNALANPKERLGWLRFAFSLFILLGGGTLADRVAPMRSNPELETLKVGIVQPATSMSLEKTAEEMIADFDDLTNMTTPLKGQVDLIFWPEQTTPWPLSSDVRVRQWISSGAEFLQADILTGALWDETPADPQAPIRYFNAVAQVRYDTGVLPQYYAKRKLVPFGEYVPFSWMHSFTPIVDSFEAGEPKGKSLLVRGGWRVWPLICYEDTFPELSRGAADRADLMAVFTNDGWFGQMGARSQHFAHSILRSVEQGRSLVRVANDGLSGVIHPDGSAYIMADDQGRTTTANAQIVEVEPLLRQTPYSQSPLWLWPTIAWALSIITVARSGRKGWPHGA